MASPVPRRVESMRPQHLATLAWSLAVARVEEPKPSETKLRPLQDDPDAMETIVVEVGGKAGCVWAARQRRGTTSSPHSA